MIFPKSGKCNNVQISQKQVENLRGKFAKDNVIPNANPGKSILSNLKNNGNRLPGKPKTK